MGNLRMGRDSGRFRKEIKTDRHPFPDGQAPIPERMPTHRGKDTDILAAYWTDYRNQEIYYFKSIG